MFCIVEAARHLGIELDKAKVAIQGFGNAGSIAATLITAEKATVVAVSDSTGGIHNPNGLDVSRVIKWKQEHGTVQGFPGSKDITNAQVLEVECDILIPAALENQITEKNAGKVKARLIAEAANGPTTPEADEIFWKAGKFMIPDILCNAGGVTVSYFEWVQDLNRDHWSERVVNEKLREIMVKAFQETLAIARREKCYMRTAAYLLAVQRVADATQPARPLPVTLELPRPARSPGPRRGFAVPSSAEPRAVVPIGAATGGPGRSRAVPCGVFPKCAPPARYVPVGDRQGASGPSFRPVAHEIHVQSKPGRGARAPRERQFGAARVRNVLHEHV